MDNFLRRNPILKTKRQFHIDSARVNGATTEIIRKWFQKLALPHIKTIKPENRWNMDEAGIMEGMGDNGLVVGSAHKRFIQKKQPGSRAWTSFIECISALGRALHPLVIFKGKSVQQQWFKTTLKEFKGWEFTATENGWTTDDTALEWLKKVFIPQTQPHDPSEPRLLVLDGHGSHETTEFMWECYSNNIQLLFLPPHTSHVLQPLDLAVFSLLKTLYRKQVGFLSLKTNATPVGKRNFLRCYYKARLDGLIARNIKSG
jgi:4-hydroxybenzoate polyprenyltransferase